MNGVRVRLAQAKRAMSRLTSSVSSAKGWPMSFRARLALVAAAAVALAVVIASFVIYFVVRGELVATVDGSLRTTAAQLSNTPLHDFDPFLLDPREGLNHRFAFGTGTSPRPRAARRSPSRGRASRARG